MRVFGSGSSAPLGGVHLARNAYLLAVLATGWRAPRLQRWQPGLAAAAWPQRREACPRCYSPASTTWPRCSGRRGTLGLAVCLGATVSFAAAVLGVGLVRWRLAVVEVAGPSMEPVLSSGDRCWSAAPG